MDPLSITTASLGLIGAIANAGSTITIFIKNYRDARNDLFAVHGELNELRLVLELLKDDASAAIGIPPALQDQVINIIQKCGTVVEEIDRLLAKHSANRIGAVRWVWDGKDAVTALQQSLATHRAALMLAVETIQLCLSREIKADTTAILDESSQMKKNTDEILGEVARLRLLLSQRSGLGESNFMLDRYLDSLTTYAETVVSGDMERETVNLSDNESLAFSENEKTLGIDMSQSQIQSPSMNNRARETKQIIDTTQIGILNTGREERSIAEEKERIHQETPVSPSGTLDSTIVTQTQPMTGPPTMIKRKVVPRSPSTSAPASEANLVSQKRIADRKSDEVEMDQTQSKHYESSRNKSSPEPGAKLSQATIKSHLAQPLAFGEVKIMANAASSELQNESHLNQDTQKTSPASNPNLLNQTLPKTYNSGILHRDFWYSGRHSCCAISSIGRIVAYLMSDQLAIKIRHMEFETATVKVLSTKVNHGKVNKVRFFPGEHHFLLAIEYMKPGGSAYNFLKDVWDYSTFEVWQIPEGLRGEAQLLHTSAEIKSLRSWDAALLDGKPVLHSVRYYPEGAEWYFETCDAMTGERLEFNSTNVTAQQFVKASVSGKTVVIYDRLFREIRVRTMDAKANEFKTIKLVYPKGASVIGCLLDESERVWLNDKRVTIAQKFGVATFPLTVSHDQEVEGQWLSDELFQKKRVPLQDYARYKIAIDGYTSSVITWAKAASSCSHYTWEKETVYKQKWSISEDGRYLVGVKKSRLMSEVTLVGVSR